MIMHRSAGWPKPTVWGAIGALLLIVGLCSFYLFVGSLQFGASLLISQNGDFRKFIINGYTWEMPASWLEDASESTKDQDLIVFRDGNGVIKMSLVCPYRTDGNYEVWTLKESKSRTVKDGADTIEIKYEFFEPLDDYPDTASFAMIKIDGNKVNCQLTAQSAEASLAELNAIYESITFNSDSA